MKHGIRCSIKTEHNLCISITFISCSNLTSLNPHTNRYRYQLSPDLKSPFIRMGNSLRCCLACILPCGALDLIRIVHINGVVQEITSPITAGEILQANPNHVLTKPTSQGVVHKILILSPETELRRGGIYFLIPENSIPENKRRKLRSNRKNEKKISCYSTTENNDFNSSSSLKTEHVRDESIPDMNVGKSYRKEHLRKRSVEVWRPHLDSIFED